MADALLLKCVAQEAGDAAMGAWLCSIAVMLDVDPDRVTLHRAIVSADAYAFFEPAPAGGIAARPLGDAYASAAASAPPGTVVTAFDRLDRVFDVAGTSAGAAAPFRYVVEMNPAAGWQEELFRWYDTEHMPGLAATPGCVRARRFLNPDRGPYSLACYDLTDPAATHTASWLAVRHTPWSDRMRPQFRDTLRTMFSAAGTAARVGTLKTWE